MTNLKNKSGIKMKVRKNFWIEKILCYGLICKQKILKEFWKIWKILGFSKNCAQIWLYNSLNTKKFCFGICLKAWLTGEPNNKPDGSLNDCLECDETQSGPVFKYFAGRTRRNSGIVSGIERPDSQVYNITHCYY